MSENGAEGKRVVLAVIGAHGSGKTTLLEMLRDKYGVPFFSSSGEVRTGFIAYFNDRHAPHFGFRLAEGDTAGPGEVVYDYRLKDKIRHLMDEYAILERKEVESPAIFTHRAVEKALKSNPRVIAISDMMHPAELQFVANLDNVEVYFIEVKAEQRLGTEEERGNYGPLQRVRDVWIDYHKPRLLEKGRYREIDNNGSEEEFIAKIEALAEEVLQLS